ncbi:MAG: cytochrome c peroxidase, partial [Armatimonadota bacterium]
YPQRDKAELGLALFQDTTLSTPAGQSCASCHQLNANFIDPRTDSPTSEGAVHGLFGNRQAPGVMYAKFVPPLTYDPAEDDYTGGLFWDGRANTLQDQAKKPFLNPIEMGNANQLEVVNKVKAGPFANELMRLYGADVFADTNRAYDAITDALAQFEKGAVFGQFTSRYDRYLAGEPTLNIAEKRGLALFEGKAGCAGCHPSQMGADKKPPMFTDFTYDNIGLPKNTNSKFFTNPPAFNPDGAGFMDKGLEETTHRPGDVGRFRVLTLRNIAVTAPYFHNGFAKTLTEAVQFYNKRDSGIFGPSEFPGNRNPDELGDLKLTDQEVDDIVSFLNTLTDLEFDKGIRQN